MSQPEQVHRQDVHPARHRAGRALAVTAAIAALVFGVAACGDDDDGADVRSSGPGASGSGSGSGSASGSGSGSAVAGECEVIGGTDAVADATARVNATLSEFSIAIDPATVAAGAVRLVAENAGAEPHEVVIARGTPEDITVVDGAPDEDALGDALVGEIEAFAAGQTCDGTFELTAGDYVLFCALVETHDGTVESHYEEGMVTTLTVG